MIIIVIITIITIIITSIISVNSLLLPSPHCHHHRDYPSSSTGIIVLLYYCIIVLLYYCIIVQVFVNVVPPLVKQISYYWCFDAGCHLHVQGERETFETYYRKQRRKQARLALEPSHGVIVSRSMTTRLG